MSRPDRVRVPLAAAALALLLAGCTPGAEEDAAPVPAITGTPIPLTCAELVPAAALSGLWSGYAPDDSVEPTDVSTEIAGYDGLVCAWSEESGASFQIALARLDPAIIEALKNQTYTTSTAVPTYGRPPAIEGYFSRGDSEGVADVFVEDVWLHASGSAFVEPGDPEPLVDAAVTAVTS